VGATKHTPGPWVAKAGLVWADGAVIGSALCGVVGDDEHSVEVVEHQEANAILMAAAPDGVSPSSTNDRTMRKRSYSRYLLLREGANLIADLVRRLEAD
jgi:hypothetical protein